MLARSPLLDTSPPKSTSFFKVDSPSSQLSLSLKEQLKVAIAKQVECYEKVLNLNASLKEEIQRRQKAEAEVKRKEESQTVVKGQLAEALQKLSTLQKEMAELRQGRCSSRADKQEEIEIMQLMMQKNQQLDADLQGLQSKVAELDRHGLKPHVQSLIKSAWSRVAVMLGHSSAEVTEMLESKDPDEFYNGVIRAFELVENEAKESSVDKSVSDISYSNPLLPRRLMMSRLDSSAPSEIDSQDSSLAWIPRERFTQAEQAYSTQPSTTSSAKLPVFEFDSPKTTRSDLNVHTPSVRQSSAKKPLLIEASEGLLEAISTQSEKLNALSKQLNLTMSNSFANVRTPTFKSSRHLDDFSPVSPSAASHSKTSSNSYYKHHAPTLHDRPTLGSFYKLNSPALQRKSPHLPMSSSKHLTSPKHIVKRTGYKPPK